MIMRRLVGMGLALLVSASLVLQCEVRAEDDVSSAILAADGRFWQAYNTCDLASQRQLLTDDLEFYHDKGGPTLGADALMAVIKTNLCGDGSRLRREAVADTVHVFPLRKDGVVYGAVLSGSHRFYVLEKGEPERLDGQARFTHLWLRGGGAWRMARILSFDHGEPAYVNRRQAITLVDSVLEPLVGSYRSRNGTVTVAREEGMLTVSFANGKLTLYPETEQLFFTKERDLTFEFVKGDQGSPLLIRVRERGAVVEEAPRL